MKASFLAFAFVCLWTLVVCQSIDQVYDAKSNSIFTLTKRDALQSTPPLDLSVIRPQQDQDLEFAMDMVFV